MNGGEVHVWRVPLAGIETPPPTAGEAVRASRFRTPELQQQYLRSHGALRAILGRHTAVRPDFALTETGKPYLHAAPHVKFNLAHTRGMAMVAVALEVEVGVDVERYRPMPDYVEIADRFFPPSEAAGVTDERDFFRRWTRIEAVLKARGVGLYAAGTEAVGDWTIEEIDVGPDYAAAVAVPQAGMRVLVHDFGAEE